MTTSPLLWIHLFYCHSCHCEPQHVLRWECTHSSWESGPCARHMCLSAHVSQQWQCAELAHPNRYSNGDVSANVNRVGWSCWSQALAGGLEPQGTKIFASASRAGVSFRNHFEIFWLLHDRQLLDHHLFDSAWFFKFKFKLKPKPAPAGIFSTLIRHHFDLCDIILTSMASLWLHVTQ